MNPAPDFNKNIYEYQYDINSKNNSNDMGSLLNFNGAKEQITQI